MVNCRWRVADAEPYKQARLPHKPARASNKPFTQHATLTTSHLDNKTLGQEATWTRKYFETPTRRLDGKHAD